MSPNSDRTLVERYKQAGLVIFDKSNSPEVGLTTTTESVLFGQTHNPRNLERTSGGSSGGATARQNGPALSGRAASAF